MPQFSSRRTAKPDRLLGAEPLLLVGAGKMGGAMLERWLTSGLAARRVTLLDPFLDEARRREFETAGLKVADRPEEVGSSHRTIVLAVKPQAMAEVLPNIAALAGPETVILSIAAGIRLAKLATPFAAEQPIVRAMPNTPAQVGMGMSVAIANAHVTPAQRDTVQALLAAVGEVAWLADEGLMDAVTAVSGSGPAYVFLLAECLAEASRQVGLPAELSERLARQTVAGAGALLAASGESAATLRQNVTSPRGTTAAALSVLMAADGLQPLLTRAVEAAKRRSIELG